jgi:tryptophan-rich sensory protein
MNEPRQYAAYKKPTWAPPSWLFGPVWSVLYVLIAIGFGDVFWQIWQGAISVSIALPFVLNLVFNIAFTPIQFGIKSNLLAAADILLLLATLIWAMIVIYPLIPIVTYILIPYLLWVMFATALQLSVTKLNS